MATVIIAETPFYIGHDKSVFIDKGAKFYLEGGIWTNDIWAKTITSKGVRVRIGANMIAVEDFHKYEEHFKIKEDE